MRRRRRPRRGACGWSAPSRRSASTSTTWRVAGRGLGGTITPTLWRETRGRMTYESSKTFDNRRRGGRRACRGGLRWRGSSDNGGGGGGAVKEGGIFTLGS